jgi:hypothetical protein
VIADWAGAPWLTDQPTSFKVLALKRLDALDAFLSKASI